MGKNCGNQSSLKQIMENDNFDTQNNSQKFSKNAKTGPFFRTSCSDSQLNRGGPPNSQNIVFHWNVRSSAVTMVQTSCPVC